MTQNIQYYAIGTIHSPYEDIEGMPIQPAGAAGIQGTVVVFPEFEAGLADLDGFSHVILLYHLHRVEQAQLTVIPFLDSQPHGVFATRAPKRPNPIGLSVVKLLSVDRTTLVVENVDILDGTPLLDIKPYVPAFDVQPDARAGWLESTSDRVRGQRSDDRFR